MATSTSPVGSFGLRMPSGRARTVPVTRTTHSSRSRCAASTTPGRDLRIGDDLHDAGAVPQVEEHDPAVVAAGRDPAGDPDLGPPTSALDVPAPWLRIAP
jgi:hypothetical protein